MHRPRFRYPIYNNQYQNQWRPHGPIFSQNWPVQNGNHYSNYYPNTSYESCNENYEHWCETCDRSFRTSILLEQHQQQHQKCNIDGCQFIAHPKVITKHIQMQHSTGLFKKIAISDNPEEIKKWREERKKRYPTKENIEKKAAEIKEKIDRGEKMGMMKNNRENRLHQKEYGSKRKYCNENNYKQSFNKRFQTKKSSTEGSKLKKVHDRNKKPERENKFIPHVDSSRTLKPFTGILHLLDDSDSNDITDEVQDSYIIEDEEYSKEELSDEIISTQKPQVCDALSSLMCNYESSDDESIITRDITHNNADNINQEMNIVNHKNECLKSNVCVSDNDSGPEETKIVKGSELKSKATSPNCKNVGDKETKKHDRMKKEESKFKYDKSRKRNAIKSKLPSTLLEKLLHKEIRQERNIVLQCIRHVVKNNFFQNNEK